MSRKTAVTVKIMIEKWELMTSKNNEHSIPQVRINVFSMEQKIWKIIRVRSTDASVALRISSPKVLCVGYKKSSRVYGVPMEG